MNNEIKKNVGDLIFFNLNNIFISLFIKFKILFINNLIRLGIIHIKFGIIIIIIIDVIQLIWKL